jgi:hypothetical protein
MTHENALDGVAGLYCCYYLASAMTGHPEHLTEPM